MAPTTTHLADHAPEATDAVRESGQKLKSEGSRIADEVRAVGRAFADQQKEEAARYVDDLVAAADAGAEHLRKNGRTTSARFVHGAAEQVGDWAGGLRNGGTGGGGDLIREVEGFARERPLLFFGAAFAIGFAAARFVRSSPEQDSATPAAAD